MARETNMQEIEQATENEQVIEEAQLQRGGRFVVSVVNEGSFDRDIWADNVTILNLQENVVVFPYAVEEDDSGYELVLLGEWMGRGMAPGDKRMPRSRSGAGVSINFIEELLSKELEQTCAVVALEPSRENPKMLDYHRAYMPIFRRIRERGNGLCEIEPFDFVTAEIQERSVTGTGEIEDGYSVTRYFKAVCTLEGQPNLEQIASCLNLANERDQMQVMPYYLDEGPKTSELVLLGQARRRGLYGGRNTNVDTVGEYLASVLNCPITVEALYPSAAKPQHIRLQRSFDALLGSNRSRSYMWGRGTAVTAKSILSKEERFRREACEEEFEAQEGSIFTGTLSFAPGTDMALVAQANGILRAEHGLRVAPMGSRVDDSGVRKVKVAGMRTGFFGPMPLRYDDVRELERALGCMADVRMVVGTMEKPDDLELYTDAREALADPHAATSMAAWIKSVEEASQAADTLLASLVGMDTVLARIDEMVAYAVHYKATYGKLPQLHAVFSGNAGTGKTTVARILANKLGEAGVLDRPDRFIETDRSGLVGLYVGHTAHKTHACIDRAIGGVLFIDEAYSLNVGHERDYGHEAVDALVKRLEDDAEHFVCILAGYPEPMEKMISMNPGLRSRLPFKIDFPDYDACALMAIFDGMLDTKFTISTDARRAVESFMERALKAKTAEFANARTVRNIVQRLQIRQLMKSENTCISLDVVESVLAEPDMQQLVGASMQIGFAAS